MGADQSSPLKSQRDEDIPHTKYSLGKPISGEYSSSSSRTADKKRSPNTGNSDKTHDIVVVAAGTSVQDVDPEVKKLETVPQFLPIIRSAVTGASIQDPDFLQKLDTKSLLALCARYQEHMKQCAEAVAFDQNALCVRIKEIDFTIQQLYSALQDRQKRFAKYAEQIQKVNEMHSTLNKIHMNVQQTLPLMERLNSVLPEEDQLEPFSMKPIK